MSGAERGGGGVASRSRAESFARRLTTRLRSLAGASCHAEDWAGDISSSSDNEVFFEVDSPSPSPGPPSPSPLQRSDSSASTGSQFFDSVEELPPRPVPLLRTESPVLDADVGCSRVRDISEDGLDAVPDCSGNSDSRPQPGEESLLDTATDGAKGGSRPHPGEDLGVRLLDAVSDGERNGDSKPALGADSSFDGSRLEFGEDSAPPCDLGDRLLDAVPDGERNGDWRPAPGADSCFENGRLELGEDSAPPCDFGDEEIQCLRTDECEAGADASAVSDEEGCVESEVCVEGPACVFCDTEQIKSSLAGDLSDPVQTGVGSSRVDYPVGDRGGKEDSVVEDNIPLSDLLRVLKEEISAESGRDPPEGAPSAPCPSIEVQPAPSVEDERSIRDGDEEFDIEARRKNFRRCSSLRSGKTPPGTPGRKKIVRFADVLGLDLADVKTFLDEVPTVPRSAYEDLFGVDAPSPAEAFGRLPFSTPPPPGKILRPMFQQPCVRPDFLDRVRRQNVCLENAMLSDAALSAVTGLVRVRNLDFHKSVHVRYTTDGWRSFADLQARYVPHSCDGFSDKFAFTLYAHTLAVGQTLQFAVRFHAGGNQFWDSNGGANYAFECAPGAPPPPDPVPAAESATFY